MVDSTFKCLTGWDLVRERRSSLCCKVSNIVYNTCFDLSDIHHRQAAMFWKLLTDAQNIMPQELHIHM